jgi:hypothetical protein
MDILVQRSGGLQQPAPGVAVVIEETPHRLVEKALDCLVVEGREEHGERPEILLPDNAGTLEHLGQG